MHLVSHSVFLKTLGWSLLNSVWQMASLWLLYIVVTIAGKEFTAKIKHVFAVLLLSAGTVWLLISFFTNYFINEASVLSDNTLVIFSVNNNPYLFINTVKELFNKSLPYCSIIYLVVLIIQLARYSTYYFHARQLQFTGLQKAQPALRIFVEDIANQLGIRKKIKIWLSSVADSPMTVGFLKSVILIPIATINNLSTQQVEAILLHELAHIKRNDYFLNLIITFAGILFFFNPFARLLIKQIRKEAENSCDDLVMQFRYDPHTYISALLSLEKNRTQQQLAMAANGSSNQVLLQRVKRIAGHKKINQFNISKLVLLFFIGITTCTVAFFQPQKNISSYNKKIVAKSKVSANEKQQVFYAREISSPPKKTTIKISFNRKIKTNKSGTDDNNIENEITLVKDDNNGDENPVVQNIALTIQPATEKTYSIAQEENVPAVVNEAGANFPYVPSSSFVYKITADAKHTISSSIKKIDFYKINKELNENFQKVNVEKLQLQLEKSMTELDQQKTLNDENAADEERIKGDIKVEINALKNIKSKTPLQTLKLQQQLIKLQIKIQQQNLQKQHEVLKNIEDEIRKKAKIVYI